MQTTDDFGISSQDTRNLQDVLLGDLVQPGDEHYDDARLIWNGVIEKYPSAIARCRGTADVVKCVRFARDHDLSLAIRGGGHNVAGNAVCDDGLVIDLSEMRGVHVDAGRKRVRVQGGATLKDVDHETQLYGMATALGVVSATGVAGLTLNGGMGHLRRTYGLSCDNVVSAEVVTASGDVLTASADENPDLFWALRGGGGNFGVVTSFEYELHEVGPELSSLFVWYDAEDGGQVLQELRAFSEDAPNEISVLAFTAFVPTLEEFPEALWGKPATVLLGAHSGAPAVGEAELKPLRELADPLVDLSGTLPYTDLQSMLDPDYPDGRRYYWKSAFLSELTDEIIDLVVRDGRKSPSTLSTVDLWSLGGAVGAVKPEATAFWHRDKPYLLNYEANWEDSADDEVNIQWARDGIAEARELRAATGSYGNFPGFLEDPARATFGGNYERLRTVKSKYDPTNLFQQNLNISPVPAG